MYGAHWFVTATGLLVVVAVQQYFIWAMRKALVRTEKTLHDSRANHVRAHNDHVSSLDRIGQIKNSIDFTIEQLKKVKSL